MARRQSEILGLFATPQDIQQQQRAQIMSEAQQMYTDPIARQLYTSTAGLAGGIGQAFGLQDPQMMQAQQIQQLQQDIPFDSNNQSQYYNSLAQNLINQGLYGAGYQALELANQARASDLERKRTQQDQDPTRMSLSKLTGIPANVLQSYDAAAVNKANKIKLEGLQPGETMAQFIGRINDALGQPGDVGSLEQILQSVPFDPKDAATYYATVAEKLINSGDANLIQEGYRYLEMANKEKERLGEKEATPDVDLDVRTRAAILEEDGNANSAYSRSQRAQSIAARFETLKPTAGAPGQVRDAFIRTIGGEGDVELLREEFAALSAERALSRVPPGPASDKDILFAQRGFPTEFTNAEAMSKFLRGYAKLEALKAAYHVHRANYLATKGNASGHFADWKKYRDENMAQILEEYGFNFNTDTLDQESQTGGSGNRVNVAEDFDTISREPSTGPIGGRSRAARGQ